MIETFYFLLYPLEAFLLSIALVRVGLEVARQRGFVARPNPIVATHTHPVALGGGIGLMLALFLSALLLPMETRVFVLGLGVGCVFIVGVVDDLITLKPLPKFILQVLAVGVYLGLKSYPTWAIPIAAFFLLACQNAWNLVDVMDGLTGRISVGAFLGLALCATLEGIGGFVPLLAVMTAGAVMGFLFFNEKPAKTYLGDAGSLSLGMLFGVCVLELVEVSPTLGFPLLLAGLIPFFELGFLIVVRTKKGIPFYKGSPDHFALRMLHNGHEVRSIVRQVLMAAMGLDLVAGLVVWLEATWVPALVSGAAALSLFLAGRYFDALPSRRLT